MATDGDGAEKVPARAGAKELQLAIRRAAVPRS
jgi:hypothetical protein